MKLYRKLGLLLIAGAIGAGVAHAATEAEMKQAQALAAQQYLRYANNQSDYLDALNPTSLAELKNNLKDKEKENLKAFENIGMPSDYKSWDKDKVREYWSTTFFSDNASKLIGDAAANQQAHARIRNKIGEMTVTVIETQAPEPAPTPEADPVATPPSDPQANQQPLVEPQDYLAEQEAAALADMEENQAEEENAEEAAEEKQPESSGTWVYVMILCILVAVVIALVIYASKTMKAQKVDDRDERDIDSRDSQRSNAVALAESNRLREKYAESLAAKNDEIRSLGRKAEDLERENYELKSELRHLKQELHRLQTTAAASTVREPRYDEPVRDRYERPVREQRQHAPERQGSPRAERHIYLGRVNSRGLFVRADKNLNPGHSVYRLSTDNGVTGTFTVVDEPSTISQALNAPEIWLAGGCVAKDITDTYDREYIVTEAPGTAVFEDGAWKVLRKAKIRFD